MKMLIESFSGIRGLYEEDITEEVIINYTQSFVNFLKKKNQSIKIVLGMDTRESSNSINELMKKTLLEQGADVVDVGFNTTPAIQQGVRYFKADGGIIITASHNEPEYNGWKFLRNTGSVLKPEEIQEVIQTRGSIDVQKSENKGTEENKEKELQENYIDFVLDILGEERMNKIKEANLKIAVDPNGGTAATIIKQILEKLNVDVVCKNMELGIFNRLIEPNKESLASLAESIDENNADLGAGWDCDGDRVELVIPKYSVFSEKHGRVLSGQQVLALLVEEVLTDYNNGEKTVVINDATSDLVTEIAKKHNADVLEVEVGEINVVEKMDEVNAIVGGEGSSSGGIFPPSKCRDGTLSLVLILDLIAKRGKITDILTEFPDYYTLRKKIECNPEKSIKLRKKLEELWNEQPYVKEIRKTGDETGGFKIVMKDNSWVWYRASKTEAGIFRIIADSTSKKSSEDLLLKGEEIFLNSSNKT
ncbi:hypothetical protein CEE44_01645 [Candidatus Woesearchaeota archaeon B3_Woes]|nr:MAG: hypothetical protein CEE44_01645 [Candidatus Woesearchaeota archaeon B3_Woes]